MTQKELEILVSFHKDGERQGPGSCHTTKLALELTGIIGNNSLKIVDIGCGTGAQTIILAKNLNGQITAVDIYPEFLEILADRAIKNRVQDQIKITNCSMDKLPFHDQEFDMIWSEGAIYIMGFQTGIQAWKKFLKKDGILAITEISWITNKRPKAIQDYWDEVYPEIDIVSNKISILEKNGFSPIAHFILPENCWLDNYYHSIEKRISSLQNRFKHHKEIDRFVQSELKEVEMYKKYKSYYSYGFYIAKRIT